MKDRPPRLADKALSSTERHGRSLKAVNEKLAELVASLRDHKERLSAYSRSGPPPATGNEEVEMEATTKETALATELSLAREALNHRHEEQARLRDRLSEIEAENRRVCDEFVAVQEQNADLVALYAAIEQLHGAATRADVIRAIQEVVINMVGSEEFALFELTPDGRRLAPVLAFGVSSGPEEIEVGCGTVGHAAAAGSPYVAAAGGAVAPPGAPPPTACVPLKVGDRVTGALVIYTLLAHKPALTDFDHELFSLLERHAALALHFRAPERPAGAR
jgi:GAF domain-containing protein